MPLVGESTFAPRRGGNTVKMRSVNFAQVEKIIAYLDRYPLLTRRSKHLDWRRAYGILRSNKDREE
jgi:hypothetical protein